MGLIDRSNDIIDPTRLLMDPFKKYYFSDGWASRRKKNKTRRWHFSCQQLNFTKYASYITSGTCLANTCQMRPSGADKTTEALLNIHKVITLKIFLDIVPSSSADNVATRVAWMLLWGMEMRVKSLGLSTREKSASQDSKPSWDF